MSAAIAEVATTVNAMAMMPRIMGSPPPLCVFRLRRAHTAEPAGNEYGTAVVSLRYTNEASVLVLDSAVDNAKRAGDRGKMIVRANDRNTSILSTPHYLDTTERGWRQPTCTPGFRPSRSDLRVRPSHPRVASPLSLCQNRQAGSAANQPRRSHGRIISITRVVDASA